MAMLVSLRGSVCWWQGDELALTEADIPHEKIQDPYGIAFWPEFKGRDGCRTPMPWSRASLHAGFSQGRAVEPWLPVPVEHAERAVDVHEADARSPLHFMRRLLAWRRTQPALLTGDIAFLDAPEPVLALTRTPEHGGPGPALLCLFNLGAKPIAFDLPAIDVVAVATGLDESLQGGRQGKRFLLPAHGIFFGEIR